MKNLFVLDFETTGLNVYTDEVIEYSILDHCSGKITGALVKPKKKRISDFIKGLTGISNEMVADADNDKVAINSIMKFISDNKAPGKVYMVAHNGDNFDFPIFRRLLNEHKIRGTLNVCYMDSLRACQCLYPKMYSFKQASICKFFGIVNDKEHRASGDVIALSLIMEKIFEEKCNGKSLPEIHKLVYDPIS